MQLSDVKPPAVILDMDGSLCDVTTVLHHVQKKPKDFDAFHAESRNCPANQLAIDFAIAAYDEGYHLLVVTARMEMWREITEDWLEEYLLCEVDYEGLWMRPNKDYRKDTDIKLEIYNEISEKYKVVFAVDDNPHVIKLWEDLGIPTLEIPRPEGDISLISEANKHD